MVPVHWKHAAEELGKECDWRLLTIRGTNAWRHTLAELTIMMRDQAGPLALRPTVSGG